MHRSLLGFGRRMQTFPDSPTDPASLRTAPTGDPASTIHERLVIVGGGMAGWGLCDRLVRRNANHFYQITLIGDEPTPAYDRVHLSSYFGGRSEDDLLLADRQWYADHQIELHTGRRIHCIDRTKCEVVDSNGVRHPYDRLVLATGSSAFVPPIPGADLTGVFVYRTLEDLQSIRRHVDETGASTGLVIGGGLLGLEAAKVMIDLGLSASVVERAPGLMPRQLDSNAAKRLRQHVESIGVDVHVTCRTDSITTTDNQRLQIAFSNRDPMVADLVIIAAGVRPNDQLGKDAGLETGARGGIVVDRHLCTSDPKIHAIGECVRFRDHVYGLVAPCYRMADVLAQHLVGEDTSFEGADESAELKLLGVQVATFGRQIGDSRGGVVLNHSDDSGFRAILLDQGRIVGASCVGQWEQLPQVRLATSKHQRMWPTQRTRFVKSGSPWRDDSALSVHHWPDDSVICNCLNVTKGTVGELIKQGCDQPKRIAEACGASTACGSCANLVSELAGCPAESSVDQGGRPLLWVSALALALLAIWCFGPAIAFAESVQSDRRLIDWWWRDDLARQITGFSLLGALVIGQAFSLRKRIPKFQFGDYRLWRWVHSAIGTLTVAGLIAHTGLRLGENFNAVLGVTFLSVATVGALAGLVTAMESRQGGPSALRWKKWRSWFSKLHFLLAWPLPILIAIHVVSFYWFRD
ncbi:FAD-dependent oxidoreductase [Crateriforma spongiae]|uniref:FAD-dependent oxidoreductase n=1 Tax=Crateriforma spongiae TaxID=2724528 RepID=UPI001F4917EB|nr:FAD-dependent oxidoreductase [Crateriforma spongiae]